VPGAAAAGNGVAAAAGGVATDWIVCACSTLRRARVSSFAIWRAVSRRCCAREAR